MRSTIIAIIISLATIIGSAAVLGTYITAAVTRNQAELREEIKSLKSDLGHLRGSPATAAAPAAGAAAAAPVPATTDPGAVLCLALEAADRIRDNQGLKSTLMRTLRGVDEDAYFRELNRFAEGGGEVGQFINDGSERSTDQRYVPILLLIANRSKAQPGSSYESMRLATWMARFDRPELQSFIEGAAQAWLDERGRGNNGVDSSQLRPLIQSGNPRVHAEILRWIRGDNSNGNGDGRQAAWEQLGDLYASARAFPLLGLERKDDKLADADRQVVLETERWVRENRQLLVLDRAKHRMVLAKDLDEAERLRASGRPAAAPAPEQKPAKSGF